MVRTVGGKEEVELGRLRMEIVKGDEWRKVERTVEPRFPEA